jgi:hypothetical protein
MLWFVVVPLAACGGGRSQQQALPDAGKPAKVDAGLSMDAGRPDAGGSDAGRADAGKPAGAGAGASGQGGADAAAGSGAVRMTPEQLRDPATCKTCHPRHYNEWSGSMHAYSALDPVFIAMNKRGQRETNGALGDFCVKCHAPMAVADGLTRDGLNLGELPDQKRGVSCYFCHNVVAVGADHNGQLTIAGDNTMRGSIEDPAESAAHHSAYTKFFDHAKPERNELCGGCHDIVNANGVALERTYKEYREGLYAHRPSPDAPALENCGGCHMPLSRDVAAVVPPGLEPRVVHEHLWPGIDVALVDFPNKEAMRSAIEDCQLGLASIAFLTLTVTPPNTFIFRIETNAGHNQPSGSAQDRRMWLEISSFDADGKLIASSSSGIIGDQEIEDKPLDDPQHDPQLWMFRDRIFDARGEPTHNFWDAAPSQAHPTGYESTTLEVRKDTLGQGTHFIERSYVLPGSAGAATPARVTARIRIRPMGMDVLRDLVDSQDLDPAVLAEMPTFTFRAQLEWKPDDGFMTTISAEAPSDCTSYRCMLDPQASGCSP